MPVGAPLLANPLVSRTAATIDSTPAPMPAGIQRRALEDRVITVRWVSGPASSSSGATSTA